MLDAKYRLKDVLYTAQHCGRDRGSMASIFQIAVVEGLFKGLDEAKEVGVQDLAQVAKLNRIQPSDSSLHIAHKRLWPAQCG